MKKHLTLIVSTALMLASCASVAEYSQTAGNQRFQDGVYSRPTRTVAPAAVQSEASALAEKTRGTDLYIRRGRIDTLYIPENKAAQFRYDWKDSTTTLTIVDERDYYDRYAWNFGYGYGWGWGWPYHSWYGGWHRPWGYYSSWYSPWYSSWYGGWYSPWYSPWYSSWYWDPWYDPFWDYGWYGWGPYYYYDSWAFGYGPWGPWGYGPRLPYHGGYGYGRNAVYTPRKSTVEGSNRVMTANGQRRNTFGENPTVRRSASGTRSMGTRTAETASHSAQEGIPANRRASSYVRSASSGSSGSSSRSSASSSGYSSGRYSSRSYESGSSGGYSSGSSSSGSYSGSRSSSSSYSGGSSRSSGGGYSGGGYSGGGGGGSFGGGGGSSSGGGGHRR